jgi:site-specific recombinase XerD
MTTLAPLIEAFFTDGLCKQRQASQNTIAAYRDAFRLLLGFAKQRVNKTPSQLGLEDLDAPMVAAFLDHLERERRCGARSRNARLAAVHSFFRFISIREPAHAAQIQRVLAIPQKRFDRNIVTFLTGEEIEALLAAPDRESRLGRRDHLLLMVAIQTGLRVSELVSLRFDQIMLGASPHIRCQGKGRKERCTPLTRQTAAALRAWQKELHGDGTAIVFAGRRGSALSRDAVERLLAKHVAVAATTCRPLQKKSVSPHVLRHTAAVRLLQAGVDRSTIALWLGHESVETTQIYLDADLSMKEKAIALTAPLPSSARRFRPDDRLLAFLAAL